MSVPRSRAAVATVVVVAVLLGVAQFLVSQPRFELLIRVALVVDIVALAILYLVPWIATGPERRHLRSTREGDSSATVEMALTWTKPKVKPNLVSLLVNDRGIHASTATGDLKSLSWSEVRGLNTVQYEQTIRQCMQIVTDEGPTYFMPVSPTSLLPLSPKETERFYDRMRTFRKNDTTLHQDRPE